MLRLCVTVKSFPSTNIQRPSMSTEFNPYAPPKANVEEVPQGAVWRDGDTLLLRPGTIWPTRCVKCNLPAVQPVKARWVSWHSPWLYFLLLLNLIICLQSASK